MRAEYKPGKWVVVCAILSVFLAGGPLVAADCNGNGSDDDADIASGVSDDCNGNLVPDECELLPVELTAEGAVEVSESPRVLRAGDLDGDEDADLVVGGRTTAARHSAVFTLINTGERVFELREEVRIDGSLFSLAVGDLDGDGDPDVATAHQDDLWVLLNDGGGGLGPPSRLEPPEATKYIIAADVNGDGVADLITANDRANSVSVLIGGADGVPTHIGDFSVQGTPIVVAADDLDRDGDVDLAVLGRRSRSVAVLLNSGDATFAPEATYRVASSVPADLATGDFDGDGAPDIAASTSTAYSILIGDGQGGFAQAVNYPGSGASIGAGDMDGDGDIDLAVAVSPNLVSVKVNDGTGRFGVFIDSSSPGFPSSLVLEDFDADGRLDAGVAAGDVVVLWNGDGEVFFITTEVYEIVGCERAGQGCQPHVGGVADLDGDGDMDAIGLNTNPGSFTHLINDGSGNMKQMPPHTFGGEEHLAMEVGDVDGDGDPDVVTVEILEHEAWVILYEGNNVYAPPVKYPVAPGGAPIDVALGDLDGDDDLDIATANQTSITVLFNDGAGAFSRLGLDDLPVGNRLLAVIIADIDGDGDADLAAANAARSQVSVLLNEGARTFAPPRHYGLTGNPHHLAFGDFNADGQVDLVTANDTTSSVTVLLNRGDGTFPEAVDYAIGRAPYSLAVVDFDVDGIEDLVTANADTGSVSIFRGRGESGVGDGTFDVPVHIAIGRGAGLRFAYAADFDQDGDPDLVTTDRIGRSMTMVFNESSPVDTADYLETVCTPVDFQKLSALASSTSAADRFLKFTLPASDGVPLQETVYQNTRRYPLHEEFLVRVFPDVFPSLEPEVYDSLVGRRASRQYFVGTISRIRTDDGLIYGFSVFARFDDAEERLSLEEVAGIHDRLRNSFHVQPLRYFPTSLAAIQVAEEWENPPFEIFFAMGGPSTSSYEPYTKAVGYGTVRLLDAGEFETANSTGQLSFQDVLVLDQAPRDIEGVVGGVITAEPQGELSHVAIRTNRRGTPNAFVRDALEAFGPFDGQLVRLEVKDSGYTVEGATRAEAEDFWASNRPELSVRPSLDPEFAELSSLEEIAAQEMAAGNASIVSRFGGKASGLARLQTILTGPWEKYRLKGFGIPVRYYLEFIESNRMTSVLDRSRQVTYREFIDELLLDDRFRSDSVFRFDALEALRDHMRSRGEIDPVLIERLQARIGEVYSHLPSDHRVRFRSSSNMEDAIEFNGAGLYESTSVCLQDELDADDDGPSICDPTKNGERTITRALRRVWASLWSFRAYEERAFFGIDQRIAAMAVLSNKTFVDERANGVAFTGNPSNPLDRRYLITVQMGDESVVSPEPGTLPEKDILEMSPGGEVARIIRAVPSSLTADGEFVLSDDRLRELGRLMWYIDQNYPIDTGAHAREDVLLDMEFKVESGGELAVKQIRPFLLTSPAPGTPTFRLDVPPDTAACGLFTWGQSARTEYELKSSVRFAPGLFDLPTTVDTFTLDLVEEMLIGPGRESATPSGPGLVRVEEPRPGLYRFSYEQTFTLPGGDEVLLELPRLEFEARDGVPVGPALALDAPALTDGIILRATIHGDRAPRDIVYSSCTHETLPLWEIETELDDGSAIFIEERHRPEPALDFGPASIARAEVTLGGQHRSVSDYFDLVYSAARHNQRAAYWVILDPPMAAPGVAEPVHAVELRAPVPTENVPASANYLGADLGVLAAVGVASYSREGVVLEPGERFRRGDANADGSLDIADAITLLDHLFLAKPAGRCEKAADANDDARINLTDAVWILLHLHEGASIPEPLTACGADPTADDLGCESFGPCG